MVVYELVTKDNIIFKEGEYIKMSKLIKDLIDEYDDITEIPLHNIKSDILRDILDLMKKSYGKDINIDKPPKKEIRKYIGDDIYNFVQDLISDHDRYIELINVSDYLDCAVCLDILSANLAELLKKCGYSNIEEYKKILSKIRGVNNGE